MKLSNPFRALSHFEMALWLCSVFVIIISFLLSGSGDVLTVIASLIGVTALIFVAKGSVVGQILTVVFAIFYGIISYFFRYYGEMITYLLMTAPSAIAATIAWLRHPYNGAKEVRVNRPSRKVWILLVVLTIPITAIFGLLLYALGNANLAVSTISVTTSFIASYLAFFRSPYYALAYAANDIVLIVLWLLATISDLSYLPMILCFVMFLLNDLYGFFNWRRMQRRQSSPIT